MYGIELILDLHGCDARLMTREFIEHYFVDLCKLIKMERCDLHFWDDEDVPEIEKQKDPKTVGISAVQFIITSSVVIHSLPLLESIYLNIFSCKDFGTQEAADFTSARFASNRMVKTVVKRTMA